MIDFLLHIVDEVRVFIGVAYWGFALSVGLYFGTKVCMWIDSWRDK